jgi:hypothetical protein
VEKWTKDKQRVEHMLYGGNNLDKARDIFEHHRQVHFTYSLAVGDAP